MIDRSERGEAANAAPAVRPLTPGAGLEPFFDLAARTFAADAPPDLTARDWQRYTTEAPGYDQGNVRGVATDGDVRGGYILELRQMRIGQARVPVGCIGGVVTHPAHRRQGVATALMRDSLAYTHERGLAFLLLHGAPRFYDRFGYIDVFDTTLRHIARAAILDQPASAARVRPATAADAPAMLDIYRRHHGPHTGSFERTLDHQGFLLRFLTALPGELYPRFAGLSASQPVVAVSSTGQLCGYLMLPFGPLGGFGPEVAADTPAAALALARYHADLLAGVADAPTEVVWPLPPESPTYYALADTLPVRSATYQQPHAGWMASLISAAGAVRALLPVWQERWRGSATDWQGSLTLVVGAEEVALDLRPGYLQTLERPAIAVPVVRLSPHTFTRLVFGCRTVAWAVGQQETSIPEALIAPLTTLLPGGPVWIAPTDGC